MANDFRLAGQRPNEPTTVWSRIFLWCTDVDVGLVDVRSRFVHTVDQHSHVRVDNHFFVIVVTQFESVVEEDVRLYFVIVRIDHLLMKYDIIKLRHMIDMT